jgi:magnesium transporter
MHTGFARLSAEQTVEQGLEFLRTNQPEGRIVYFYVVDSENRLRGVVPTRRLLLSPLESLISEIMIPDVVALPGSATVLEACEFFILHRFLAFPVVDEKRRLIGVVDVELYTKELSDLDSNAYKDDLFQLIGVHLTQQQQASPLFAFRKRFPWLITNIAGGILAAFLVGIFEKELDETVALALFIPVVLALSESVSIQSVSLALQALHGERPSWWALAIKLRAEVATGLLLGATSALCVAAAAFFWLGHLELMVVLLSGIAGSVACSAVIGVTMPNLLRLLQRDPRVASGPVALAAADMVTLLLYFNLARWIL